ncbi:MAG: peptidoglycan DD-metalloendopeptidase family protein [Candidatus Omnitrophica bacterium]|nr:peptidoglycan DD-metalloendopeptidase family protein [Candidatus Omnitrophota bacterium]
MNLKLLFFLLAVGFIAGCATMEYKPLPEAPSQAAEKKQGIYHKVQKGQTLWYIARTYGVAVEDITEVNNIPNAAAIEVGQLIFVPGAKGVKEMASAYSPDKNKDEFAWPMKGKILSYFKDHRGEGSNRGIDIEAGDTDTVKASREGQVVLVDYMSGYNQTVMIDHGDGFISVYALNRKLLVKLGDHVYKGEAIAQAGSVTGRGFLHFEIRRGKEATNPLYYLP